MRAAMIATGVVLVLAGHVSSADAAGNPETVGGRLGTLIETVTAPVLPELSPPVTPEVSVPPVAVEPTAPPPAPDPAPVSTAAAPSPVAPSEEAAGAGVAAPLGGGDPAAPLATADARPQPAAAAHAGASGGEGRAHTATRREPRAESSGSPATAVVYAPPRQVFPTADPHSGPGLAPIVADFEPGAPLPALAFYAALVAALGSLWLASRRSLGIRADRDRWKF